MSMRVAELLAILINSKNASIAKSRGNNLQKLGSVESIAKRACRRAARAGIRRQEGKEGNGFWGCGSRGEEGG